VGHNERLPSILDDSTRMSDYNNEHPRKSQKQLRRRGPDGRFLSRATTTATAPTILAAPHTPLRVNEQEETEATVQALCPIRSRVTNTSSSIERVTWPLREVSHTNTNTNIRTTGDFEDIQYTDQLPASIKTLTVQRPRTPLNCFLPHDSNHTSTNHTSTDLTSTNVTTNLTPDFTRIRFQGPAFDNPRETDRASTTSSRETSPSYSPFNQTSPQPSPIQPSQEADTMATTAAAPPSSPYTPQGWIADAAIVRTVWMMVMEQDKKPELKNLFQESDQTTFFNVLLLLDTKQRLSYEAKALTEVMTSSAPCLASASAFAGFLERFRKGPTTYDFSPDAPQNTDFTIDLPFHGMREDCYTLAQLHTRTSKLVQRVRRLRVEPCETRLPMSLHHVSFLPRFFRSYFESEPSQFLQLLQLRDFKN